MARITFGGREIGSSQNFGQSHDIRDLGDALEDGDLAIDECSDGKVIEDNPTTRLVLKTGTFPPNNGTDGFNIAGYLCHAKRSRNQSAEQWEDVSHFDLRTLRLGEYVRIQLGPNNLKALFLALASKYKDLGGLNSILAEAGVTAVDPASITILEGKERETLGLLMQRDDEFWNHVAELDTRNALETKALQLEHQRRKEALRQFRKHLDAGDWSESNWENYFKENEWLFGLGLSYHYLSTLQNQANLGGADITGRGTDQVDYLMRTSGDTRFTVLVDIKKPNTRLLHPNEYRSNIYRIDQHIAGGVAQLQSYCYTWQTRGSRDTSPQRLGAYTYEPRGMLIVGNLAEFHDDDSKRKSFELFRRHIHNPQILTFDELYNRAEYMVTQNESQSESEEPEEEWEVPF